MDIYPHTGNERFIFTSVRMLCVFLSVVFVLSCEIAAFSVPVFTVSAPLPSLRVFALTLAVVSATIAPTNSKTNSLPALVLSNNKAAFCFDWRHKDGKKIPYLIYLKQEGIFSFPGIYDTWHNPVTDEQLHTFSILTTNANPMMRYIHNTNFRMPVILHENEESLWLDPMSDESTLTKVFTPYDDSAMQAYPVAPDIVSRSSKT